MWIGFNFCVCCLDGGRVVWERVWFFWDVGNDIFGVVVRCDGVELEVVGLVWKSVSWIVVGLFIFC